MSQDNRTQEKVLTYHFGPVYEPRPPLGDSLAACRPGPHDVGMLTGDRRLVNCEACKKTEDYRYDRLPHHKEDDRRTPIASRCSAA